jgi:uncharacterized protein (DUF433 family)
MSAIRKITRSRVDPVAGGFYTVQEAARLLHISQPARIKDWLQGRKSTQTGPVIQRQYQPIGDAQELGFWDLIEVRFVEHFRRQGVSLQALRKAAQTARELWHQQHPFATSKSKYLTNRKTIFQETATELKDKRLLDLVTRQYEMYVVIEDFLDQGLAFDPSSGVANRWQPSPKELPRIVVDPRIAYGQPVVSPANIPTARIYDSWQAEGGSFSAVASWFEVDESQVREAVEFELRLLA